MEISASNGSGFSALELKTAVMAKDQQEREGQQVQTLLETSEVPQAKGSELGKGGLIDTFA